MKKIVLCTLQHNGVTERMNRTIERFDIKDIKTIGMPLVSLFKLRRDLCPTTKEEK